MVAVRIDRHGLAVGHVLAAPRAPLMVVVRMSTAMGTPLITSLAVPRASVVVAACMPAVMESRLAVGPAAPPPLLMEAYLARFLAPALP